MNSARVVIPNELIRDSAGAGKTFKLINRFIRLLYHGQPPERIVALTFTRKAAGEFFAGILTKLADAAADPKAAKKLGEYIEVKNAQPGDFRAVLRGLIHNMGRLSLGTLDSFFHRLLAMFPMEFGLGSGFAMMSDFEKQRARLQALETLLTHSGDAGQESLVRSFQLATAGKDSRDFVGAFEQYLTDCHELMLRTPLDIQWGNSDQVWPDGFLWAETGDDLEDLVAEWRVQLNDGHSFSNEVANTFLDNADHFAQWAPGKSILPKSKNTLLKRALNDFTQLKGGEWGFAFRRRTFTASEHFCRALVAIIKHCVSREVMDKLRRTQGIHGLLSAFETQYDKQVRRQGLLTFADLPALLASRNSHLMLDGAGPNHLDLEYRLDGAFDHWLLDEFQDTSREQWDVIDNLIDEVMQDPSGARTFFCIGDQKQSIYQWRGGDPRLLDYVADHYKNGLTTSSSADKAETYRCCEEIVELLNHVFGNREILAQFDEPGTAANRWSTIWQTHVSKNDVPGHAQYLTVEDEADRWPLMAELLASIQPIENKLKCVVLVQTNRAVRTVVEFLRGVLPGLSVVGDSVNRPGADNPLGAALLSLFRAAAHPADTFSSTHLCLTPLGKLLPADDSKWAGVMRSLQRDIHQAGFEATARDWVRRLEGELAVFGQWRARQFLELARQFDEAGSRDIDDFLRFIPVQEHTDSAAENVVQVMTIHKAKGLTFDVTIVPDLEGNRLDEPRKDALYTHTTPNGDIDWILDLPRQDICALDPQLSTALAQARSEACYENFCKLYVALTRARQGLYIITTAPKAKSTSQNYLRLLHDTLAAGEGTEWEGSSTSATNVFEVGTRKGVQKKRETKPQPFRKPKKIRAQRRNPRLPRRKPSDHEGAVRNGVSLFEPRSSEAATFGSAVHEVFEQIEWVEGDVDGFLGELTSAFPQAVDTVRECFKAPEIAALFKSSPGAQVWREKAFDIVLDGELCSGVFDRVVFRQEKVEIIDFKTDRVDEETMDDAVQRHQSQLNLYRRVLGRLTGREEESIGCRLVFTHLRQSVSV